MFTITQLMEELSGGFYGDHVYVTTTVPEERYYLFTNDEELEMPVVAELLQYLDEYLLEHGDGTFIFHDERGGWRAMGLIYDPWEGEPTLKIERIDGSEGLPPRIEQIERHEHLDWRVYGF